MIIILATICANVSSIWIFSSMFFDQYSLARRLYFELRPFYPVTRTAYWILTMMHRPLSWWMYIFMGLDVLCWFILKDRTDDEDRWKRRRRKVAEKIKATNGKLTVVPIGASS
jgi:hypothetical protein